MGSEKSLLDIGTEDSTTEYTVRTPPTETPIEDTNAEEPWSGATTAVPWPGNTYIIVLKGTDRAISLNGSKLCLQGLKTFSKANNRWHCVERQGYYGLCNTQNGVYLGHDGKHGMRASARQIEEWELITPRLHPAGGYQLLMPKDHNTLMIITTSADGWGLERRYHGDTLWEFIQV